MPENKKVFQTIDEYCAHYSNPLNKRKRTENKYYRIGFETAQKVANLVKQELKKHQTL